MNENVTIASVNRIGNAVQVEKGAKVTYANNKKAGTAKVEISGINAYEGTIYKTFKIAKATRKVKAIAPKSDTTKKVDDLLFR